MGEAIVTLRDADGTALGLAEFVDVFREGGPRDIEVSEGEFTFDVAGPQDAVADTIAEYRAAGASVRLGAAGLRSPQPAARRAHGSPAGGRPCRVRDGILRRARGASTAEVAAELDLDTSTVSEHLQRAERNVLSTVLSPSRADP